MLVVLSVTLLARSILFVRGLDVAGERGVEFAAEDEDRRGPIEEHQCHHDGGEPRIISHVAR